MPRLQLYSLLTLRGAHTRPRLFLKPFDPAVVLDPPLHELLGRGVVEQAYDVLQGKPTCRGALVRNSCGALTLSHASSASRAIPLPRLSSPLTSGAVSASSILLQPGV